MRDRNASMEEGLRQQMLEAADRFPVGEPPRDLHRRATRRRRTAITALTLTGCAALTTAVVFGVPLISGADHDRDLVTSAVAADYIGSNWQLTRVRDGATSTEIPSELGAGMSLLHDGMIRADDGVNSIGGQYVRTSKGFTVVSWGGTQVGYSGSDPHRLAAILAFAAIAQSAHLNSEATGPDGTTILSVDRQQLILQAGTLELTFRRIGPATSPSSSNSPAEGLGGAFTIKRNGWLLAGAKKATRDLPVPPIRARKASATDRNSLPENRISLSIASSEVLGLDDGWNFRTFRYAGENSSGWEVYTPETTTLVGRGNPPEEYAEVMNLLAVLGHATNGGVVNVELQFSNDTITLKHGEFVSFWK